MSKKIRFEVWADFVSGASISVPDAEDVAERIRKADEWDLDDCRELCELAGLSEEWAKADGESFEQIIYKAAEILGVEVI